jgi:hypothetical protein
VQEDGEEGEMTDKRVLWAVTPDYSLFKADFTHVENTRWRHGLYDPEPYYMGLNLFVTEAEAVKYALRHFRGEEQMLRDRIEELKSRLKGCET